MKNKWSILGTGLAVVGFLISAARSIVADKELDYVIEEKVREEVTARENIRNSRKYS